MGGEKKKKKERLRPIFPHRHEANQVSSFSSFNFDLVIEFPFDIYIENSRYTREGKKKKGARFSASEKLSKCHWLAVRRTMDRFHVGEANSNRSHLPIRQSFALRLGKYEVDTASASTELDL